MKVACLLAPHLPAQVERQQDPSLAGGSLVVGGRPWDDGAVLDGCPQAAAGGTGLRGFEKAEENRLDFGVLGLVPSLLQRVRHPFLPAGARQPGSWP